MNEPLLVVHGVANRDQGLFQQQVKSLHQGVGRDIEFIPAYWGHLGAPSADIVKVIPESIIEVRAGLSEQRQIELILAGALRDPELQVNKADLEAEIRQAWQELNASDPLPAEQNWTDQELQSIGAGIACALAGSETEVQRDQHDVRASIRGAIGTAVRATIKGVSAAWSNFKGTALSEGHKAFRSRFLPAVTDFLGDVIVYQRNRPEVWSAVRNALDQFATDNNTGPLGTIDRPLPVIGHSLGGVIAFDMAVAMDPPLYISKLITMGSQPSFFHVVDPRGETPPGVLPPYISGKKLPLPTTIGQWTSFWEPLDPFAFLVEEIFEGKVHDVEIEHLPDAGLYTHSDYWIHSSVHDQIGLFLD